MPYLRRPLAFKMPLLFGTLLAAYCAVIVSSLCILGTGFAMEPPWPYGRLSLSLIPQSCRNSSPSLVRLAIHENGYTLRSLSFGHPVRSDIELASHDLAALDAALRSLSKKTDVIHLVVDDWQTLDTVVKAWDQALSCGFKSVRLWIPEYPGPTAMCCGG